MVLKDVFLECRPFLILYVSLQFCCRVEISSNVIGFSRDSCMAEMKFSSMASSGGLGSGGRDKKSLTGLLFAGRYLISVVH